MTGNLHKTLRQNIPGRAFAEHSDFARRDG